MSEEETNPYELLDVKQEATEQEIRTAYRQRSLKVHPDRNPNNPDAAKKFHELNQAYELLLDPLRRLALDAKLRVKQARAERFKSYDNKRKNLVQELEERERAFKKQKLEKQKEAQARFQEEEKIKDEGRRLREGKQKQLHEQETENKRQREKEQAEMEAPTLQSTDTTVRVKYSLSDHPELTTPESLSGLLKAFGETDTETIVISLKTPKKAPHKPPKHGTALVPFKRIGDAFAAVCASGKTERGLSGIEIGWVGGKEPQILGWLKKMGKLGPGGVSSSCDAAKAALPQMQSTSSSAGSFSSFPETFPDLSAPPPTAPKPSAAGLDYESLTLMRMRQAERERLEREILEQEANE
ncbi:dnaj domain protein cwf23 [Moniliophthora roreri MCA 2997]|uniref:Dnaj domain protein cwf23 n=1 Tax=Moniliophthora roreri (strain MCA 2997) TaxID=1381753 RepID=V2X2U8_MONRO|nr:dnaj domain protein cwf23 [Moniliophthora roreri MCA 2997]